MKSNTERGSQKLRSQQPRTAQLSPQPKLTQQPKLWQQLQQQGLLSGTFEEHKQTDSPWYIKLMLAFSGWLAAVFLLGFMFLSLNFLVEEGIAALFSGISLIVVAAVLFQRGHNEFVEHLALALSFTGQVLVLIGLDDYADTKQGFLFASVMQLFLVWLIKNHLHRFCCTLMACFCLIGTLALFQLPHLAEGMIFFIGCWLVLVEFSEFAPKPPGKEGKWQLPVTTKLTIGYACLLAVAAQTSLLAFEYAWVEALLINSHSAMLTEVWVSNVLFILVSLYVVWQLLQRYPQLSRTQQISALVMMLVIGGLAFGAQGMGVGVVILVLGFASSNALLMAGAIFSLIVFIIAYYYHLDVSLLYKSYSLLALASVLLIARWWLRKTYVQQESDHE